MNSFYVIGMCGIMVLSAISSVRAAATMEEKAIFCPYDAVQVIPMGEFLERQRARLHEGIETCRQERLRDTRTNGGSHMAEDEPGDFREAADHIMAAMSRAYCSQQAFIELAVPIGVSEDAEEVSRLMGMRRQAQLELQKEFDRAVSQLLGYCDCGGSSGSVDDLPLSAFADALMRRSGSEAANPESQGYDAEAAELVARQLVNARDVLVEVMRGSYLTGSRAGGPEEGSVDALVQAFDEAESSWDDWSSAMAAACVSPLLSGRVDPASGAALRAQLMLGHELYLSSLVLLSRKELFRKESHSVARTGDVSPHAADSEILEGLIASLREQGEDVPSHAFLLWQRLRLYEAIEDCQRRAGEVVGEYQLYVELEQELFPIRSAVDGLLLRMADAYAAQLSFIDAVVSDDREDAGTEELRRRAVRLLQEEYARETSLLLSHCRWAPGRSAELAPLPPVAEALSRRQECAVPMPEIQEYWMAADELSRRNLEEVRMSICNLMDESDLFCLGIGRPAPERTKAISSAFCKAEKAWQEWHGALVEARSPQPFDFTTGDAGYDAALSMQLRLAHEAWLASLALLNHTGNGR